jgi:hypothetical protein
MLPGPNNEETSYGTQATKRTQARKIATRLVNFRLNEAEFEKPPSWRNKLTARALFLRTMYLLGLQAYRRQHPAD